MVSAEDVLYIYRRLSDNGIQTWLTGGWGIDALLGEQTRPHKDMDALLSLDDMVRMGELFSEDGYNRKKIWSENAWVLDRWGNKTATAFVLQDKAERQFDVHAMRLDENGNGVPAWTTLGDLVFMEKDLAGNGIIAGFPIKCITPKMQVTCHRGYELPDQHILDLQRLHERFGVE